MGGERHGGKRGRGAEGKTPFIAAVQTSRNENPAERKVVYLKVQTLNNFRGRSLKAWAKRNLARTSEVLSDGMPGFRTIGEVVQHHEMKEMPGGWRSATSPPMCSSGRTGSAIRRY